MKQNIKSIHSSLKIEANSLSIGQVRDVINGRMVLGEQKEIQEVKNTYEAYERFHGIMTKYVVKESGESTIFIEFMLVQIDKILGDISIQIGEDNSQLSEGIKKMLEVMNYDIPYSANVLMEKLGLKSKEGFRRNYLRPALDMNLIRMTVPDKPNSRSQRY